MKEQFLQKIFSYIKEQELISAGDVVLAGVSGGADSMCLLEVLRMYKDEVDFALRVIHVEHGIRGEDSMADAAYVRQFCEERQIACEVVTVDALSYSKAHGVSVEEAARELRYGAFEEAARELRYEAFEKAARATEVTQTADMQRAENTQTAEDIKSIKVTERSKTAGFGRDSNRYCVKIAVAHHMEDQAETVLWQMIRGSDIKGMGGMRPGRERIIRPLLATDRAHIEAFLREEGVCWREDATNDDRAYTRNRLRLDVLPVLMQLNGQAVGHLCESARRLQETEDYLEAQAHMLYEHHVQTGSGGSLLVRASLLQEQPLMQRRVLYRALEAVGGSAKDLGARHVGLLQELYSRQVGRELSLPYGVKAARTYEGIGLLGQCTKEERCGSAVVRPDQIHMEVLERAQICEISKKKYTKWFDYDKIEHSVQIRRRQSGDYLVVDSAGHRQKLKNYLVNEKIPKAERDELLLLADGSHVLWVVGYRISDYYKVDEHTKRVLKVQLSGGNKDE